MLLSCSTFAFPAAPLVLLTEDYAPYAWAKPDGRVQGISAEIVSELMRRGGVGFAPPRLLPWARAIAVTERTPHTCVFSAARTADREKSFKWIGPIGRLEWVFFARASDQIAIDTIEQARPYTIGTYVSNATVPLLQQYRLKIEVASSDRANPVKLKLGRIDLWAVGRTPGIHLLRGLNIEGIEPVFKFAEADLFLACNPNMSDIEVLRLNRLLREMFADNTVRAIYTRYGYADQTPDSLAD